MKSSTVRAEKEETPLLETAPFGGCPMGHRTFHFPDAALLSRLHADAEAHWRLIKDQIRKLVPDRTFALARGIMEMELWKLLRFFPLTLDGEKKNIVLCHHDRRHKFFTVSDCEGGAMLERLEALYAAREDSDDEHDDALLVEVIIEEDTNEIDLALRLQMALLKTGTTADDFWKQLVTACERRAEELSTANADFFLRVHPTAEGKREKRPSQDPMGGTP